MVLHFFDVRVARSLFSGIFYDACAAQNLANAIGVNEC